LLKNMIPKHKIEANAGDSRADPRPTLWKNWKSNLQNQKVPSLNLMMVASGTQVNRLISLLWPRTRAFSSTGQSCACSLQVCKNDWSHSLFLMICDRFSAHHSRRHGRRPLISEKTTFCGWSSWSSYKVRPFTFPPTLIWWGSGYQSTWLPTGFLPRS
jgi:hypothetical protein